MNTGDPSIPSTEGRVTWVNLSGALRASAWDIAAPVPARKLTAKEPWWRTAASVAEPRSRQTRSIGGSMDSAVTVLVVVPVGRPVSSLVVTTATALGSEPKTCRNSSGPMVSCAASAATSLPHGWMLIFSGLKYSVRCAMRPSDPNSKTATRSFS